MTARGTLLCSTGTIPARCSPCCMCTKHTCCSSLTPHVLHHACPIRHLHAKVPARGVLSVGLQQADVLFLSDMAKYMKNDPAVAAFPHATLNHLMWWSWNPNSGDTGGIVQDDWLTVRCSPSTLLIHVTILTS